MQLRAYVRSLGRDESRLAWLAGLLFVIFAFILPATACFSRIPGDLGDARFNSVVLEHGFRWLTGRESSLWSPAFFYPFRDVLAFSDNHFGTVGFYSLARIVGFDRENAYLAWLALGIVLNYGAMFYALRRLGLGSWGAACGAFLFAAGLPTVFKLAHAQLTYRFAVPLVLVFVWEWLEGGRPRILLAAGLLLVWQFFCSIYLGVFLSYLLCFVFLARLLPWTAVPAIGRKLFDRDTWRALLWHEVLLLVAVVTAFGLLLAMLRKYAEVGRTYALGRSADEIFSMLPQPGSYLISDLSILYKWLGAAVQVPMRHEHQMFIGVVAGVLVFGGAVLACRRGAHPVARMALLALGSLVLFTMNFGGNSFYHLVASVPGLSSVRAVSRIVLVMLVPAAILLAFAVDSGTSWLGRRLRGAGVLLGLCLLALMSAEVFFVNHYNTPVNDWRMREALALNGAPSRLAEGAILFVEPGVKGPKPLYELDGMILAQDRGLPTLNGYSGNMPTEAWAQAALSDACQDASARVRAYARFAPAKHDEHWLRNVMSRVVVVSEAPCTPGQVVVDDLSPELIRGIHLEPRLEAGGSLLVTIRNASQSVFPSTTRLGPIRLSWRVIGPGVSPETVGWDTRFEVNTVIQPGASSDVLLDPGLPSGVRTGRIEVSLVQEGVRWLHSAGMAVGVVDLGAVR